MDHIRYLHYEQFPITSQGGEILNNSLKQKMWENKYISWTQILLYKNKDCSAMDTCTGGHLYIF